MTGERNDLSEAVVAYLGYRAQPFPGAHWDAVVAVLGMERAQEVEWQMLAVLADLNAIEPDWRTQTLIDASDTAASEIRKRYPELDDRAGKALFWAYSYGHK